MDIANDFADRVRAAAADGRTLCLRGGGSKDFLGGPLAGDELNTRSYAGILEYDPGELILRARSGTPLTEIEAVLASHQQCLPFDPPHFAGGATLGGAVASGLAGPQRAALGPARDHLLGVSIIDGRGERLQFGGPVIKNVAGYDVSRLMVGALGVLGILLDLTLRVVPKPAAEQTLCLELPQDEAIACMNALATGGAPLLATAWCENRLYLKLGGAHAHVDQAAQGIGGERLEASLAQRWWCDLRDQRLPLFAVPPAGERHAGDCLWRLLTPATAEPVALREASIVEWVGAQRWVRTDIDAATVQAAAASVGGSARIFRGAANRQGQCAVLPEPVLRIQQRLKQAFDPSGVFNPGRLHPDL